MITFGLTIAVLSAIGKMMCTIARIYKKASPTMYVHILDGDGKKLDKKVQKLKFIGNTETTGSYKV